MNLSAWLDVLADAYGEGCRAVQFIGGEATLHPDLATLVVSSRELGYESVEVFSNLTHVSQSLLAVFASTNVSLATSFYAPHPELHDAITQGPGSFRRTVEVIRRAVAAGIPVRAGIIRMATNSNLVEETREFLQGLGVTNIGVDHVREVGRGRVEHEDASYRALCGGCGDGKLAIDPDGVFYPCIMARDWPVGAFGSHGVHEIVSGAPLRRFLSEATAVWKQRPREEMCPLPGCTPVVPKCQPGDQPQPCSPDTCGPECWPGYR